MPIDPFWGAVIGGAANYFGASEQADANLAANQANIQANKDRKQWLDRPQETPFSTYGGGKTGVAPALQPSLQGAYETSNIEAGKTNPLLAQMRQNMFKGWKPSIGSLGDAQTMVDRDIARGQGERDYALDKGLAGAIRTKQAGINPMGYNVEANKLANIFAQGNQTNRERDALNLYQTATGQDIANLGNLNKVLTGGQVGNKVPAFDPSSQAATVNALIAQTPMVQQIAGSPGLGYSAIGTGMSDYLANQRATEASNKFLEVLANRTGANNFAPFVGNLGTPIRSI